VLPSPLVEVNWKIAGRTHAIAVKRDDLIHPLVSGNKWRKLGLVLADARKQGKNTLVSFGGAWSNHLLALAVAAEGLGFKSAAFVRGDELEADKHGQLARYKRHGMTLLPVSRAAYRDKAALYQQYFGMQSDAYFIDEGGASPLAIIGCAQILAETAAQTWHDIWLPVGTGTTLQGVAGYLAKNPTKTRLHGVLAVQSIDFQHQLEEQIMGIYPNTQLHLPANGPRFGKFSPAQLAIARDWYAQTGIMPDPVYGLKTLEAIYHSLENQNPGDGARVLWIHTGGLQGWDGFPETRLLFS
jgi:1-aminocyclopropane-1-carboxylate deaminase